MVLRVFRVTEYAPEKAKMSTIQFSVRARRFSEVAFFFFLFGGGGGFLAPHEMASRNRRIK